MVLADQVPLVDLRSQYLGIKEEIDAAMQEIIVNGAFIGGAAVADFEKSFAQASGNRHCIGVGNGTDAIFLTLKALGIGAGDEVATVANSFIATSESISLTGAKPIFVDCNEQDYCIDVGRLEDLLKAKSRSRQIRAIIPVHLYGCPAPMPQIMELAKKYNVLVVEDCAQAHLAKIEGKGVGTFGIASTYSFYPGKNLGAFGDAGAVVTDDDDLMRKIRMLANHGRIAKYDHEVEGVNSRLDGLQASVLSVKLKYLKKWTDLRRRHAQSYSKILSQIDSIICPVEPAKREHVFHLYVIRSARRDKIMQQLGANGIQTVIHYPIALPALKAYRYLETPVESYATVTKLQSQVLSLPMFAELTLAQIERICDIIKRTMA